MLTGCGASGEVPISRDLPQAPAFAKPVSVKEPEAGEPALAVAARERAGRMQANRVITALLNWYAGVRRSYKEAR